MYWVYGHVNCLVPSAKRQNSRLARRGSHPWILPVGPGCLGTYVHMSIPDIGHEPWCRSLNLFWSIMYIQYYICTYKAPNPPNQLSFVFFGRLLRVRAFLVPRAAAVVDMSCRSCVSWSRHCRRRWLPILLLESNESKIYLASSSVGIPQTNKTN